jgi:holin (3TMs family)
MGVIGNILGAGTAARQIGEAVGGVAEIFVGNRAAREAAAGESHAGAISQYAAEFADAGDSRFDRLVNGLNRLPRPLLALGTLGLFAYAMAEPAGFSTRMESLALVPEPLWWLLGAIVSFYFGARELHHRRTRTLRAAVRAATTGPARATPSAASPAVPVSRAADPDYNAAVEEWRRLRR